MQAIIRQYGIQKSKSRNIILKFIGTIVIYSMVFPLLITYIWTSFYQEIYFSIFNIPKIPKKDYFRYDRWNLTKLNIWQKINCVYCEFANGTLAWTKAIGNQTEIYSCAIKHKVEPKGHKHQEKFYEYEDFS